MPEERIKCVGKPTHFSWARITNEEVRRCTDQPPLTHITLPYVHSSVTLHVPIHLWTTVELLGMCDPFAKELEPPIGPTASYLALDR